MNEGLQDRFPLGSQWLTIFYGGGVVEVVGYDDGYIVCRRVDNTPLFGDGEGTETFYDGFPPASLK